jgi:hypothetical protein
LTQTSHRRARKDRKGPSGFNHLGPAPGPKCSGLRHVVSPAVPLDLEDLFAGLARFAVQLHFLGLILRSLGTSFKMARRSRS